MTERIKGYHAHVYFDADTVEKLKRYFAVDISRPNVNTGFFSGQGDLASVPLEKYLVALGLAAK